VHTLHRIACAALISVNRLDSQPRPSDCIVLANGPMPVVDATLRVKSMEHRSCRRWYQGTPMPPPSWSARARTWSYGWR